MIFLYTPIVYMILFINSIVLILVDILKFVSKFDAIIAVIIGAVIAIKNFRFQSIHSKRLLIMEEAYEKIKLATNSFKSLTNPIQNAGDLPEEEKIKDFATKANEMISFLDKKRLFFNTKERKNIDDIISKFFDTWGDFRYKKIIDIDSVLIMEKIDLWQKVWHSADKEIPALIHSLDKEFQKTLGLK